MLEKGKANVDHYIEIQMDSIQLKTELSLQSCTEDMPTDGNFFHKASCVHVLNGNLIFPNLFLNFLNGFTFNRPVARQQYCVFCHLPGLQPYSILTDPPRAFSSRIIKSPDQTGSN